MKKVNYSIQNTHSPPLRLITFHSPHCLAFPRTSLSTYPIPLTVVCAADSVSIFYLPTSQW
jgi:hypothetical protein